MVCDSHLREDVTQGVFVALAKQAVQLANRPVLSGWLHCTARNIAAQTVRTDVRRRAREQEAVAMNELIVRESETSWETSRRSSTPRWASWANRTVTRCCCATLNASPRRKWRKPSASATKPRKNV